MPSTNMFAALNFNDDNKDLDNPNGTENRKVPDEKPPFVSSDYNTMLGCAKWADVED